MVEVLSESEMNAYRNLDDLGQNLSALSSKPTHRYIFRDGVLTCVIHSVAADTERASTIEDINP